MGFGHRVYRTRDPRAYVLAGAVERLYTSAGDRALYELALEVERTGVRLLAERHPERRPETNVEFYTWNCEPAQLLTARGIPDPGRAVVAAGWAQPATTIPISSKPSVC